VAERVTTSRCLQDTHRAVRSYGVWILLLVSVGVNLLQNQRLNGAALAREGFPRPGTRVPRIDVVSSNGQPASFGYGADGRETIMYYFSTQCGWCERNWASVSALERATRGRYRFLAVTTAGDGVRQTHAGRLPVVTYWGLPQSQRAAYQFGGTPHTVVVSPSGHVLRAWSGAYFRQVKTDLERYFQVRLPELPQGQLVP
jgi:hypothetical protein